MILSDELKRIGPGLPFFHQLPDFRALVVQRILPLNLGIDRRRRQLRRRHRVQHPAEHLGQQVGPAPHQPLHSQCVPASCLKAFSLQWGPQSAAARPSFCEGCSSCLLCCGSDIRIGDSES